MARVTIKVQQMIAFEKISEGTMFRLAATDGNPVWLKAAGGVGVMLSNGAVTTFNGCHIVWPLHHDETITLNNWEKRS